MANNQNMKLVEEVKLSDELQQLGFSAGIYVNDNPINKEISELGKQATQFKKQKNWDKAIECLLKVKELQKQTNTDYSFTSVLRLPKYYMYAERYDEALEICQGIVNDILNKKTKRFGFETFDCMEFSNLSETYALMAKIHGKKNNKKRSKIYALNAIHWQGLHSKTNTLAVKPTADSVTTEIKKVLTDDLTRDEVIEILAKSLIV